MLIDFSVRNYRSFGERMTLSMLAADREADRDPALGRHAVVVDERGAEPLRLLRAAAIYGPNGAGKSNLVKAMWYVKRMVLGSPRVHEAFARRTPFRLDPAYLREPSEFEITIHHEGERYTYGFAVDGERVLEEWLFAGLPRTRLLFERQGDSVETGRSWKGGHAALTSRTRPDALFLAVAADFNQPVAAAIHEWFEATLLLPFTGSSMSSYTYDRLIDGELSPDDVRCYLGAADTGIGDVHAERRPLPGLLHDMNSDRERPWHLHPRGVGEPMAYRVAVGRTGGDGSRVELDLNADESRGTKRMVEIAGPWVDGLRDDAVLVVDEFDNDLHPLLARFLLSQWHAAESRAQLILVTHNTDLLDRDLLRRDQAWFVEKDRSQQSQLYSLAEFRDPKGRGPRPGDNYRRGYLAGRYGAVPVPGEVECAPEG